MVPHVSFTELQTNGLLPLVKETDRNPDKAIAFLDPACTTPFFVLDTSKSQNIVSLLLTIAFQKCRFEDIELG